MKRVLLIGIFLVLTVKVFPQTALNETEKISSFCKVWGFLKYYHPKVSKGKFDWDKEFMTRVKSLSSLNSKEDLSEFFLEWINDLGRVKNCKKGNTYVPDSLKLNLDLSWMDDSTIITKKLSEQLHFIEKNRNDGRKYYIENFLRLGFVNFDKEKEYKDSAFPSVEMRLLALSRYWNIVNYFFPYKYLVGEHWNHVLDRMIPAFKEPKDTIEYHLAMAQLVASTNDSHASFMTKYITRHFGYRLPAFRIKIMDGKAVVDYIFNDSLAKIDDIQIGDALTKMDGQSIEKIIREKGKYIGASNEPTLERNLSHDLLLQGSADFILAEVERDGSTFNKLIHRYGYREFRKFKWVPGDSIPASKILDGNIGYVNMGVLKLGDVNKIMNSLMNTKAIIFDIRNYPQGTMYKVADFLNKEKKPFAKFTKQDLSFPGVFTPTQPYYCGSENKDYYKGKVVLLFNEKTQSHAEFTAMALQTAPNVISIGSQTAGADGNVTTIVFPGGYKVWMTGLGVYYPDGRETQRIGIVPDIEVKPTIEGIRNKKDEVLEKAIEIIRQGK